MLPFCWTLPPRLAGFGGKGIRTPDFQLAKLALYQLSYAPCKFSILDCRARIANAGARALSNPFHPRNPPPGKTKCRMPILRFVIQHFVRFSEGEIDLSE